MLIVAFRNKLLSILPLIQPINCTVSRGTRPYSRVALNGACMVPIWTNLFTYITFSPANNFLFLIPFLSGLFSFLTRLLYSSGFRPKIVVHKCIAQATVGTSATVLITSYFIVYGFFVVLFCTYTLPLRKDNMMETIWLSG